MNTGIQKHEHITYKYTFMKAHTYTHPFVSEFLKRLCAFVEVRQRQRENETGRERTTEALDPEELLRAPGAGMIDSKGKSQLTICTLTSPCSV